MNYGPLLFLGIFFTFSCSWLGMIFAPQLQVGSQQIVINEDTGVAYPAAHAGQVNQGEQVYRSLGCAACHTQVVRGGTLAPTPGVLRDADARFGPRFTVAADYLFDHPVMLGSERIGPDLKNEGARQPNVEWQLRHLYNPRLTAPNSTMPQYPFLFAKRKLGANEKKAADKIYDGDSEIVPKAEATQLVQYLLSLRADTDIFEAPMPAPKTNAAPAAASTNAPAAATATNSASTTNLPAK